MSKNLINIPYLEKSDFDDNGNLTSIPSNMTVLIMIQGNFCGYCTQAKPEFQKLSKELKDKNIMLCTIQTDSDEGRLVGDIMPKISTSPGVPDFVLYKGGRRVNKKFSGPRTVASFKDFIKSS